MSSNLSNVAKQLWGSYNRALTTNPILTKSFTSFTGFILGDGIAQLASKGPEPYDYARTARFATFGFTIHASGAHFFYKALDAMVFPNAPKSTKAVLAKMLIDQTIWTPISICIFYAAIKTLEGRREQIAQTIRDKFWSTLLAGYTVWPLAHLINFRFISNEHRVLYLNVVTVGWNCVLTRIASSESSKPRQDKHRSRELKDVELGEPALKES